MMHSLVWLQFLTCHDKVCDAVCRFTFTFQLYPGNNKTVEYWLYIVKSACSFCHILPLLHTTSATFYSLFGIIQFENKRFQH